ncbi:extensin-like domain-containing protein [Sphingomicrobium arenosum]|uniref:extensin-like domain-containing protein n=1 Tax=Sphingomicrobium arenosum TaxID=2233861 RepID=UPI00224044A1|nr:extensin family protein [Sphingomicrobium arenosum]
MASTSRRAPRWPRRLLLLALLAALGWGAWRYAAAYIDAYPEQFPFTPLDLADPVGPYTDAKLAALASDPQACLALVRAAGIAETFAAPRQPAEAQCGYTDGITLDLAPSPLATACPVAAALYLWQRDTLAPAAERHLGTTVTPVHNGSYNCRRLYGRADGPWSRHATADAIDIAGFRTADGRALSLLADWDGAPAEAAFLREARDGACALFSAVLSPDYNAAHADHLHLAMREGSMGWSACR